MGFAIFRPSELEWVPRGDDSGRTIASLSDSLAQSRANVWRYPRGARGKRHLDGAQEEVFVVLDGTLTVDLGERPERHELERGSVLVVRPGTILQLRNAGDEELVLFIYETEPPTPYFSFMPSLHSRRRPCSADSARPLEANSTSPYIRFSARLRSSSAWLEARERGSSSKRGARLSLTTRL